MAKRGKPVKQVTKDARISAKILGRLGGLATAAIRRKKIKKGQRVR